MQAAGMTAAITGDTTSLQLMQAAERTRQAAVEGIAQNVKQSWNDAEARNGTAGASAMVLTELGTQILGQKGLGLVGDAAKLAKLGELGKAAEIGEDAARVTSGPVYKTTKEATEAAEALGFRRVNETVNGQAVYTDGRRYITRDIDGHNGGAWKMAYSVKDIASKETRFGTFDSNLNCIGD
jgi:hypothetical protein